jgi:hypothetical protein
MSRQGILVAALVGGLMSLSHIANAQSPTVTGKNPASSKAALPGSSEQRSVDAWNTVEQRLDAIDQKLKAGDVEARLAAIEKAITDLNRPSLWATLLPAVIAAAAAIAGLFIGGVVNDRLQRTRLAQEAAIAAEKAIHEKSLAETKAQQERELAEKQSRLQIGNAVVDWQLKQLYLLYGPVRALLGQSFGLYRQMNKVLEHADSELFRFVSVPDAQGQNAEYGEEFQIKTAPQQWERFRTVMHITQVYGRGFGVETYFDEIVAIGARIVTNIEQNAGYARPEEKDLMGVFARYLAHFAVLKHLQGEAKADLVKAQSASKNSLAGEDSIHPMKVDRSAAFPAELHALINEGFEAITKDIEHWKGKALA